MTISFPFTRPERNWLTRRVRTPCMPTTLKTVAPSFARVRQCRKTMDNFPDFMKHPSNRIARSNQATPGVEGYVFDGANGSQMAFWTCNETAISGEHVHDYDEYMWV